jgi:hypothetical protein
LETRVEEKKFYFTPSEGEEEKDMKIDEEGSEKKVA